MTEHRSELINFEEEERKSQERIKASLDIKITVKGDPMNRLEEIADKLKEHKYLMDNGKVLDQPRFSRLLNSFPFDIEYLLQRLEMYEEVLKKISVPMPGSRDNELVLYYERIAEEALKE